MSHSRAGSRIRSYDDADDPAVVDCPAHVALPRRATRKGDQARTSAGKYLMTTARVSVFECRQRGLEQQTRVDWRIFNDCGAIGCGLPGAQQAGHAGAKRLSFDSNVFDNLGTASRHSNAFYHGTDCDRPPNR